MPINIFRDLPIDLQQEHSETLQADSGVRIERIVSDGHYSPDGFWYDQTEHEWIVVLQGSAVIEFMDRPQKKMIPGDHCWIPAHQKHRVASTSLTGMTIWLAVFVTPQKVEP
ncbi:MAG: cupin domain-containing protein [Planctomycetales bacterium]|nr:cupin domain-containing protein [Planctomycetales bacterium]